VWHWMPSRKTNPCHSKPPIDRAARLMRLKSIKLAGFKSFVEPTTVPFPSNMTAVVGPNGCGKSNVIDAVRWVMGKAPPNTCAARP